MHTGLFLGLGLGVSGARLSSSSIAGQDTRVSEAGIDFQLALGGAVVENIILFGIVSAQAGEAKNIKGALAAPTSFADSWTMTTVSVGGGVRGYFSESNLFLQGTLTFPRVQLDTSKSVDKTVAKPPATSFDVTKTGVGFEGRIGKEWWVSASWGLGASAWFAAASLSPNSDVTGTAPMTVTDSDKNYLLIGGGIGFSATYN
jgi:hypothetical protein